MQRFGDLVVEGKTIMRGGFMHPAGLAGLSHGPVQPVQRGISTEHMNALAQINRGEFGSNVEQALANIMADINRSITSTTTAFPTRENLEAPARLLVPLDTPVRNRLRRIPGSGKASAWKQVTSLGGGYGFQTTVTTGASSATQTVGDTGTMRAGDILWFAVTAAARTVSSITNATTVVLTATISTTTAETVTNTSNPYGAGANAVSKTRIFFSETGAPAQHATVYADKSASYKLMGTFYDITGFAMAAGATYQNQLEMEKTSAIRNLMLNEENALLNASSTAITEPWGDGTTAFGFDGLNNLITTANGTPSAQIQTAVGIFTTAHIDGQIRRLYEVGVTDLFMIMNPIEALSLAHVLEGTGSILRYMADKDGRVVGGIYVGAYINPITGQPIDILVSRFQPAGVILYVGEMLPDGSPVADVDVLPQVALPQLAPTENIQGYTAQALAPTTSAPQVYPGIVTVYEVLRLKSAVHTAKSSGVSAA